MKSSKIEKSFPELKGLSFDNQHKILERAKHEITQEGKKLLWRTHLVLLGALIGGGSGAILYFISYGNATITLIGSLTIVTSYIQIVINRNRKLIRPKVKELYQKGIGLS